MNFIMLQINNIIENIGSRGDSAENQKTQKGFGKIGKVKEFAVKDDGSKENKVFYPLIRAKSFNNTDYLILSHKKYFMKVVLF